MHEMLKAGVELMVVGMGIVFLFLALLVFTVAVMTRGVQRFFPSSESQDGAKIARESSSTEDDVVAAIGAAVHAFRSKR